MEIKYTKIEETEPEEEAEEKIAEAAVAAQGSVWSEISLSPVEQTDPWRETYTPTGKKYHIKSLSFV
jgi:hypothetical protein